MKTKTLSSKKSDSLFSLILDLPAFLLLAGFIVVPIIDSVMKSFQAFGIKNIISKKPGVWNDFANYLYLFKTDDFLGATLHTFSFVIGVVIVQFILAILLALILNSNIKGARFMRSIMMTPWVVPTVISALIWMWLFQPQYGLLKYLVSVVTFGQISDFAI